MIHSSACPAPGKSLEGNIDAILRTPVGLAENCIIIEPVVVITGHRAAVRFPSCPVGIEALRGGRGSFQIIRFGPAELIQIDQFPAVPNMFSVNTAFRSFGGVGGKKWSVSLHSRICRHPTARRIGRGDPSAGIGSSSIATLRNGQADRLQADAIPLGRSHKMRDGWNN